MSSPLTYALIAILVFLAAGCAQLTHSAPQSGALRVSPEPLDLARDGSKGGEPVEPRNPSLIAGIVEGLTETAKKILGTSTAALERARPDGLHKTYTCSLSQCFDAVLSLARDEQAPEPETPSTPEIQQVLGTPETAAQPGKFFDVFMKDPHRRHIVVIGIAGNVNTTEVGIFFDEVGPSSVKIDITSLSSTAKRKVAKAVFDELDKRFPPLAGQGFLPLGEPLAEGKSLPAAS